MIAALVAAIVSTAPAPAVDLLAEAQRLKKSAQACPTLTGLVDRFDPIQWRPESYPSRLDASLREGAGLAPVTGSVHVRFLQQQQMMGPSQATYAVERQPSGAWRLSGVKEPLRFEGPPLPGAKAETVDRSLTPVEATELQRLLAEPCLFFEPTSGLPTGVMPCIHSVGVPLEVSDGRRTWVAVRLCSSDGWNAPGTSALFDFFGKAIGASPKR